MFRGPARVLLQERKHKDGTMQNTSTVWLVDGDRLVRCSSYHLRAATKSEVLMDAVSQTEQSDFREASRALKTCLLGPDLSAEAGGARVAGCGEPGAYEDRGWCRVSSGGH